MISVGEKVIYKAFGFNIFSDFYFPELPIINNQDAGIDIEIKMEELEVLWNKLVPDGRKFLVQENLILFKVYDTAIFCIKDGNKIIVSPTKGAREDKIRLFLLGTCMGAILIQRKILPLHGSAIEIDGKAYAIIGDSGAGKSTLASAFLDKGYKLVSDDVIAVTFSDEQVPVVIPAYPQQKLWKESLDALGMKSTNYRPIIERETKYAIPVVSKFSLDTFPLAGIFELSKTENDQVEFCKLEGLGRFQVLFSHTYRNFLVELLNKMEWHFTTSTKILKFTDIFQLRRPVSQFTAQELVTLILDSIYKERIR